MIYSEELKYQIKAELENFKQQVTKTNTCIKNKKDIVEGMRIYIKELAKKKEDLENQKFENSFFRSTPYGKCLVSDLSSSHSFRGVIISTVVGFGISCALRLPLFTIVCSGAAVYVYSKDSFKKIKIMRKMKKASPKEFAGIIQDIEFKINLKEIEIASRSGKKSSLELEIKELKDEIKKREEYFNQAYELNNFVIYDDDIIRLDLLRVNNTIGTNYSRVYKSRESTN